MFRGIIFASTVSCIMIMAPIWQERLKPLPWAMKINPVTKECMGKGQIKR